MWRVQSKLLPHKAVNSRRQWHDGLTFPTKKAAEANAALGRRKAGKTYDFRVVWSGQIR